MPPPRSEAFPGQAGWWEDSPDDISRGQILVSSLLKELTDSAGDIRFGEEQEVELKGLSGLNRVYEVDWQ